MFLLLKVGVLVEPIQKEKTAGAGSVLIFFGHFFSRMGVGTLFHSGCQDVAGPSPSVFLDKYQGKDTLEVWKSKCSAKRELRAAFR
jgi:hypothetical protein